MAGLFKLPPRSTKESDAKVLKKSKSQARSAGVTVKSSGGGLPEKIATINAVVQRILGDQADKYRIISAYDELNDYISKAIDNGILSYDTETNSLDPITCTLAGVCLYTPGEKPAYVPMHHVSYVTGMEIPNQITDNQMAEQLNRFATGMKLIFHNAKFDIRVTRNQLNVDLSEFLYWDTFIGAALLNENEPKKLKTLWNKYCNDEKGGGDDYESLFDGVPFTYVPIKTGYLYAAGDAIKTYELYQFQKQFLDNTSELCKQKDLIRVASLFRDIEVPLVPVIARMEDLGVNIDVDYAAQLAKDYRGKLTAYENRFQELCDMYKAEIDTYKLKNPNHKLSTPINIASTTQIAILLYDILGLTSPDKDKPKGTGEEILEKLDTPFAKAILDYRGIAKLLSTYIEKLPGVLNPKTKKIHASFNQVGAGTGRFSSSDPNLQNIPSNDKKIRKMFVASPGYYLISCDFSQQEPRVLAHFSGDVNLIQAYAEGKDIYAFIGSMCFKVSYEQCKEKNPDGTVNPEGKKRRNSAKTIVLGIMYGRGPNSIADQLGVKVKEAEKIIEAFNTAFPQVKEFVDKTIEFAKEHGFVETVWGRKRRLPDMLLDEYEFSYIEGKAKNFDPLAFDTLDDTEVEVDEQTVDEYWNALYNARGWKQKNAIKERAKQEGILIRDNGGKIADAIRQCVNSRIQGTSADMVKLAMVNLDRNKKLKELGFRILMQVHDEIIAEAPIENAWAVSELMSKIMIESAATKVTVPQKCDVEITACWYGDPLEKVA